MPIKGRFIIALIVSVSFTPLAAKTDNTVIIKRDSYGTPHIYADATYGLFYGYGYSIAQDRLFQMEMAKRSTQGWVAEVLGEKYLEFDRKTRANYDPAAIMAQLAALAPEDRAIFEGYAAGMNAWVGEVKRKPDTLMPKQFLDFGFEPQEWTAFDVAMIFVGSMGNRFGDYNTEIENQQLLNALIQAHGEKNGRHIFDQLKPLNDPKAPTTIPKGDWQEPALGDSRPARRAAYAPVSEKTAAAIARLPVGRDGGLLALAGAEARAHMAREFAFSGLTGAAGHAQMSNIVVLGKGKSEGANAILLNGPQFGWYSPAYTYSVGLHGAGFDLVGNAPFGYPAVLFGHNANIAWGSTWGAGDVVDIYRETLNPDNPREYLFKGKYLPMERRLETVRVKGGQPVEVEVLKTVHGLVVSLDEASRVAYTKKRSWAGRELDTLLGWVHSTRARDYEVWIAQAARSAMNINWYYADKDGNIGYAFTGAYPKRRPGHDNRLPASGQGDLEWEGIQPFGTNPQVYNPSTGYIANWNNKPGDAVMSPDLYWYSWSEADRVAFLLESLDAKERFTPDEVRQFMADASLVDVNARYFISYLEAATAGLPDNDPLRAAYRELAAWDYFSRDEDRDGKYDGLATAIFQTWLPIMLEYTLKDDLPGDYFKWFASAGYPTPEAPPRGSINVQVGTKTLYSALLGDEAGVPQRYDFFNGEDPKAIIRASLKAALAQLEERFGPNQANWRLPVARLEFTPNNFLGIPQAGADEVMYTHIAMNRGTENNLTVFTGGGVLGFEAVPPGQSGFIAQDGTKARHYGDQLKLYDEFGYKRTWLGAQDVEKNVESSITLTY